MSGLGDRLKKEREMRGVSLDEIAKATRINKKFLAALEENDFDVLPAPVFVTGFLRSYASHLGVDADSLVAEYEKIKKPPKHFQPLTPEGGNQPLISKDEINRNFPLVAAVVGILVVAGLLAVFIMRSSPPKATVAVQKPEEEDLLTQPAEPPPATSAVTVEPPAEEAPRTAEPSATKPAEPVVTKSIGKPVEDHVAAKAEPAKPVEKPFEEHQAVKPEPVKPAEKTAEKAIAEKPKAEPGQESTQSTTYLYSLALTATEQDVWVYVLIDDTDVRDMYVRAGQTVFLRGNQKFILTTGNSFYLKLKVNGTAVEIPSASTNKVIRNWPVPLPG